MATAAMVNPQQLEAALGMNFIPDPPATPDSPQLRPGIATC